MISMHLDTIYILRKIYTDDTTIGEIWYNNKMFCYTLEDRVRPNKIKHETAINSGVYALIISMSKRFKRLLPELLNVPNFTGIRIHRGNTKADTSGCILVGYKWVNNKISESTKAEKNIIDLIKKNNIKKIHIIDSKAI